MNETHTWSDHCKNILLEDSDDYLFFICINFLGRQSGPLAFAGYRIGIIFFFFLFFSLLNI